MKIEKEALFASSVGIEIALSIGLGMFFGWWLDKKFDTAPWLFVLFLFAGIGSAVKAVIRIMKMVDMQDETKDELAKITDKSFQLNKNDFKENDNIPD